MTDSPEGDNPTPVPEVKEEEGQTDAFKMALDELKELRKKIEDMESQNSKLNKENAELMKESLRNIPAGESDEEKFQKSVAEKVSKYYKYYS